MGRRTSLYRQIQDLVYILVYILVLSFYAVASAIALVCFVWLAFLPEGLRQDPTTLL